MASQNPPDSVSATTTAASDSTTAFATGTSQDEAERRAFNRAFRELAFTWYWDTPTYLALAAISEPRQRLRHFLERENPAILGAYSLDFLIDLIAETQQRLLKESFPATSTPLRGWAPAMHSTESIA